MKTPIMISGMGIQCAIAKSTDTFAEALKAGQSGITELTDEFASTTVGLAGLLSDFNVQKELARLTTLSSELINRAQNLIRRAPYSIQTSAICALQAWQEANLHNANLLAERIGIVVACDQASQQYQYEMTLKFQQQQPEYLSPRYALHALETDQIGVISEILTIQGEGFVVGGASASGNVAIIKAAQLIELDLVDVCVVIGALSDLSPLALQGFYNSGAMGGKHFKHEPTKACRPFDIEHEGFIYGQGSGCLILESANSIQKRNGKPLAEFLGGAILLDGNSLPNPSEEGEVKAMLHCLKKANLDASAVDYINAHGSSSPLGDQTELNAIKQVFSGRLNEIWINSTKSLTGHCLFAAGVIEAIACVLQLQQRFIHPNLNLINKIDQECLFAPGEAIEVTINTAMSNSFGFGGINSCILLKAI